MKRKITTELPTTVPTVLVQQITDSATNLCNMEAPGHSIKLEWLDNLMETLIGQVKVMEQLSPITAKLKEIDYKLSNISALKRAECQLIQKLLLRALHPICLICWRDRRIKE